ncbi:hypothetical protein CR513_16786, partial [Mucuna pruriens]
MDKEKDFNLREDGLLICKGRICVPQDLDVDLVCILERQDVPRLEEDVFVVGYEKESGKDNIIMDFIVSLPRTIKGCDATWVIVYRLMKYAHFYQSTSRR